jgi:biopolymer transport protein ExbD
MVAVDAAGATRVREGPVSSERLLPVIQREIARGQEIVLFGADRECSFDHVWRLIEDVRALGVWQFGFIVRQDSDGQSLWSLGFACAPPDDVVMDANGMHTILIASGRYELNGETLSLRELDSRLSRLASARVDNLVKVSVVGAVSQDDVAQVLGRCRGNGFSNLVMTKRGNEEPEIRGNGR